MANNNVIIFDTTLRDGEQALKAEIANRIGVRAFRRGCDGSRLPRFFRRRF